MRPIQSLLPLLLLAAVACGKSDPKTLTDEGAKALNSGDATKAVAAFDEALASMGPEHADFLRASVGRCEALARTDPPRAKTDFLALAKAQEARVREQDFAAVANELVRRGAVAPAAEIAEAGLKRFPDSKAMLALRDTVGDAAKKSSDPEALKKLKGLGYAGDG